MRAGDDVVNEDLIILTKFRDIKINEYLLPHNFADSNDYQKRVMLLQNINLFQIKISEKEKNIISSINKFRIDNTIDELKYDNLIGFKDLIFDKYSEPIINNNENIFKLANESYLLKYPSNEFETKFNKGEKNIINIILKDYLNKIIIVEKENILFIFIFNSDIKPDTQRNKKEPKSESLRLLLKIEDNP